MDQIPTPAAPTPSSSFEKHLESDIEALALQIKNTKERNAAESASERELLKEAIRAFPSHERPASIESNEQSGAPSAPASSASPAPSAALASGGSGDPLPDYAKNAPPEVKLEIEYLLDIALQQGIGKALAASQKSPYFVQDAFHDALAGKLYPELQRRGIVK